MTDPFAWFKDQARLFHRDQRLKKASRERLERAGTEAATRKQLADIDHTDDVNAFIVPSQRCVSEVANGFILLLCVFPSNIDHRILPLLYRN